MNVLFVTISSMPNVNERGISLDLIREFQKNGHDVYILCSIEKRHNEETSLKEEHGLHILRVKIGNNKGAGIFEKGMTTLLFPRKYIDGIKKYYSNVRFDLVLYPTPPVTHMAVVKYIKRRDKALTYLLLKDIFPQNAVDIGMMSKFGLKSLFYQYFRHKEKKLYALSDYIGCMSQANVDYVLHHNPEVDKNKVEICPNSINPIDMSVSDEERKLMREKYGIPVDKIVFVYGGNLGKPQGIPFLIKCLKSQKNSEKAFFLIVGNGTEYGKLEEFVNTSGQQNVKLMKRLPKEDYDAMVGACDVGLIFLDHRFTIPNFPSRLLSYMQAKLPVLAVTDPNTDIGKVIVENGFGWWCESDKVAGFEGKVEEILEERECYLRMGERGFVCLEEQFDVEKCYEIIRNSIGGKGINDCKLVIGENDI